MKKVLNNHKASLILVLVCFFAYTIIGFTRSAYSAAIAGIIKDGVFTKTAAGIINSSFYITYSTVQIIGSYFVDRLSPFKVLIFAMVGTIFCNIAMAMFPTFTVIFIARALSGIFQFGVWPALLVIISQYISPDYRRKSMYFMPLGIASGTVLSYLVAGFVLDMGSWKDLFTIGYILLSVAFLAFIASVMYADKKAETNSIEAEKEIKKQKEASSIGTTRLLFSSGAILICFASLIKSMVLNGVASWMPTIIMECYDVSPGFSSILSMLTTCTKFLSVFLVMLICPRYIKNKTIALGTFTSLGLPITIVLVFVGGIPLYLVVLLVALYNLLANAVHQFYTVEIPANYTKYNKSGMIAGIINAFACLGSMIAGTVYGYMADTYGWNITIISWCVLICIGTLLTFLSLPLWKKFSKQM